MRVIHRRSLFSKTTGSSVVSILWMVLLIALISGCGSSSDTQTAVRNATSVDLVAQIISPSANITVALGSNIDFSAQGVSGSETYTYSWSLPGTTQTTASGKDVNAVFTSEGSFSVKLTVTDSNGNTATDSLTITVTGSTLSATITSPASNVSISAGSAINFAGQATGGTTDDYKYSWSIPGGSQSSASSDSVTNVKFNTPGTYTVILKVTDGANETATDAITVTVTASLNATITAPASNLTISAGDALDFAGIASGGDSSSYQYAWNIPGSSIISSSSQTEDDVTFVSSGTHTVTLTVTDGSGNTASDTVTITVDASAAALKATITSPGADIAITAGATVYIAGKASGGTGSYSYSWDIPGGSTTTSTSASVGNVTFTNKGNYTITFTVTDSEGNVATDTVTIN